MQAGKLRHNITIQTRGANQDSFGGVSGTTDVVTVRASIESLQGRELYKAQQYVSSVTHKIVMRYAPGIAANQVVSFNGRQFQILYVLNIDERNREMWLFCLELNGGEVLNA